MARPCVAALLFICAFAACTHDFDVFEPGAHDGGPGNDANSSVTDGAVTDSAVSADAASTDGAPGDGAALDSPADAPSDSPPTCTESGAITFGGHCYFLTAAGASWDASHTTCAAVGAHLVTIASAAEENAVDSLAPTTDRWIGLSRPVGSAATDASYVWITAEPRTYTNWDNNEPNGTGECVRLRSARWSDTSCTNSYTAICERE